MPKTEAQKRASKKYDAKAKGESMAKDFYWERDKKYFKVPYQVIEDKVAQLCKEYGIITPPGEILESGMSELFDENGNLLEEYAKEKLEYGKKAGMFGDIVSEDTWATHLGD